MAKDLNILQVENFHLLGKIQDLISRQSMATRFTLRNTYYCQKTPNPVGDGYISIEEDGDNFKFAGVMGCHNLFICPICARRRLLQHRIKIRGVINGARSIGKVAIMITETVTHHIKEPAQQILDKLKAAHNYRRKRSWLKQELRDKYGSIGHIVAVECVYGRNGFHFHYHNLLFIDADKVDKWYRDMFPRMQKLYLKDYFAYCDANNIYYDHRDEEQMLKYGFYVALKDGHPRVEADASNYVAGWSLDNEITGVNETGHEHGKSMFQLADGTPEEQQRFIEYALAVIHRTQRITYTPKMQSRFAEFIKKAAEDVDDLKKKSQSPKRTVCYIPLLTWSEIIALEYKPEFHHSIRGNIIESARNKGAPGVLEYLKSLPIAHPIVYKVRPVFGDMQYDGYFTLDETA